MAYYRVVLQDTITWEVLVVASNEDEAKAKSKELLNNDDPIDQQLTVYDIQELEVKHDNTK